MDSGLRARARARGAAPAGSVAVRTRRPRSSAGSVMQGPAGNASRGLPGGSSTAASGAGRCESGALMHSFGIFLQGLLGVVAFSTLMRESGTPAPPEALHPKSRVQAPPRGPSCMKSSGLGPRAPGRRCLRPWSPARHSQDRSGAPGSISAACSHGPPAPLCHRTHLLRDPPETRSPPTWSPRMQANHFPPGAMPLSQAVLSLPSAL